MEERKLAIERGEHVPTDNLTYILEAKGIDLLQKVKKYIGYRLFSLLIITTHLYIFINFLR